MIKQSSKKREKVLDPFDNLKLHITAQGHYLNEDGVGREDTEKEELDQLKLEWANNWLGVKDIANTVSKRNITKGVF